MKVIDEWMNRLMESMNRWMSGQMDRIEDWIIRGIMDGCIEGGRVEWLNR